MAKETDPLEPILEDLYEPDHDPPAAVSGYEYEPSEFAPEEMPAEVPGIVTVMMPGMREEREKELQGETEDSDVSTELPMPLEHPDRPPHPLHHPRPELPADASPRKRARAALETAAATPVPEQAEGHELAVDDVRFVDMVKGSLPHGWTVVENAFELDEAWLASATTNHLRRGRGEINARELNVSDREKVIQAKVKELESFFTNKVWKFIDPKANQISKDRTVTTRWVLTWKPGVPDKNGHVSGPRAKARLVLRGYQDPDLFSLEKNSPTSQRAGKMTLLVIATIFGWLVWCGDVRAACLSVAGFGRELLVLLPRDCGPLLGCGPGQPVHIRMLKSAYGLADAPLLWFREASRRLTRLGWNAQELDKCTFAFYNSQGELDGLLILHVDDMLITSCSLDVLIPASSRTC